MAAPHDAESAEASIAAGATAMKVDASKATVPAGIIAFRAMYSDDNQWALIDLQAREAVALKYVRDSADARVRIFSAEELHSIDSATLVSLPAGLSLAKFIQP